MSYNGRSVGWGAKQSLGTILALSLCGPRRVSKLLWASVSLALTGGLCLPCRVAERVGDPVWRRSAGCTNKGQHCEGPGLRSRATPVTPFLHTLPQCDRDSSPSRTGSTSPPLESGWPGGSLVPNKVWHQWCFLTSQVRWGSPTASSGSLGTLPDPDPPGHLLSEPSYFVMRSPSHMESWE